MENTGAPLENNTTTQRSDATIVTKMTSDGRKCTSNTPVKTADATVASATRDEYCDEQPGTEPSIFEFDLLPVVSTVHK